MAHRAGPRKHAVRVVVAGGGVAGLETLLALRHLAGDRAELELVSPEPRFWYRPLAVAELFGLGRMRSFDVAGIARACRASFTLGTVTAVDRERRLLRVASGAEVPYDVLVCAWGARAERWLPGAQPFRGPVDVDAVREAVEDTAGPLCVVLPSVAGWPLPAYEVALLAARRRGAAAGVAIVTPERRPLELFGEEAGTAVAALLAEQGIAIHAGRRATALDEDRLVLDGGDTIPCRRAVALPQLRGAPPPGLPAGPDGFLATDDHGRVDGADGVYAAGEATAFPVKQGGIAAQQAEAAARAIAAALGAPVDPTPFRPVLRGYLLTGALPAYLRAELGGDGPGAVSATPLWWPGEKIVGRYLTPFLAENAGLTPLGPPPREASPVSVAFDFSLEGV